MELISSILTIAAAAICIILLIKIITAPIRLIFKFLLNALLGFAILIAVNIVGGLIGISVNITLISAFVAGCFGLPGVAVLILLSIIG